MTFPSRCRYSQDPPKLTYENSNGATEWRRCQVVRRVRLVAGATAVPGGTAPAPRAMAHDGRNSGRAGAPEGSAPAASGGSRAYG
jgi:hypothetical protein